MTNATNIPAIGEIFAIKGSQYMVYMGDTVEIRHADTHAVQKVIPMTDKMREQLPAQYAHHRGSIRGNGIR